MMKASRDGATRGELFVLGLIAVIVTVAVHVWVIRRGYWGKSYRETFSMLALTVGLESAFWWSFTMCFVTGLPVLQISLFGFAGAAASGTVFGLIMASSLTSASLELKIGDLEIFLPRLKRSLAEIGYYQVEQTEALLTFRPGLWAGLQVGEIEVRIQGTLAVIGSPAGKLRKLRRKIDRWE